MENISEIHNKVIAVNCLSGAHAKKLMVEWERRFSRNSAVFVDAVKMDGGEPSVLSAEEIYALIRERIIQDELFFDGKSTIFALFLDLAAAQSAEQLEAVLSVPTLVEGRLHTLNKLAMQFGFVGQMIGDRSSQKANVEAVISSNVSRQRTCRLCLVAEPQLPLESLWKQSVVFLDVLRRQAAPVDFFPTPPGGNPYDDVGYLMYAEYDEAKTNALSAEISSLEKLMPPANDEHGQRLRSALQDYIKGCTKEAEDCRVSATLLPQYIPPKPTKKCLFFKKKPTVQYDDLHQQALRDTGDALRQKICDMPRTSLSPESLTDLLVQKGVPFSALKEEPQDAFKVTYVEYPERPILNESESYLSKTKQAAIAEVQRNIAEELQKTYRECLRTGTFDKAYDDCQKKLRIAYEKRSNLSSCEELLGMLYQSISLTSAIRAQVRNATPRAFLLLRGEEMRRKARDAEDRVQLPQCPVFYTEAGAGIEEYDDMPLKAFKYMTMNADDENMKILFPEEVK